MMDTENPLVAGEMALTFIAEPDAAFTLESTADLAEPWLPVRNVLTTGGETSVLVQRNSGAFGG